MFVILYKYLASNNKQRMHALAIQCIIDEKI